jgi:hypothetical protein
MIDDNTRDGAEPSLASAGSHGEPMAWAVLRIDGSVYDVYANEEEAKAIDEAVTGNHGVVPLCRQPALTDEGRERFRTALADAINRPMGVIPASAEGLVSPQELEAARFRIRK